MSHEAAEEKTNLPKSCIGSESVSSNHPNEHYLYWKKGQASNPLTNCLKDYVVQVGLQKPQNEIVIGTVAGAGGMACGLGLFPCLVKLVTKLKG